VDTRQWLVAANKRSAVILFTPPQTGRPSWGDLLKIVAFVQTLGLHRKLKRCVLTLFLTSCNIRSTRCYRCDSDVQQAAFQWVTASIVLSLLLQMMMRQILSSLLKMMLRQILSSLLQMLCHDAKSNLLIISRFLWFDAIFRGQVLSTHLLTDFF